MAAGRRLVHPATSGVRDKKLGFEMCVCFFLMCLDVLPFAVFMDFFTGCVVGVLGSLQCNGKVVLKLSTFLVDIRFTFPFLKPSSSAPGVGRLRVNIACL